MPFHRSFIPVLSIFLGSLLVVACSRGGAMPVPEVQIQAADYSFTAPDSIPGGLTRVRLSNAGKEDHHAQLARLNDGVTLSQFQEALKKGEAELFPLVTFQGGAGGVPPGGRSSGIADLPPGQYLVLCFVPAADGAPHLAKGMIKPLTVTAKPAEQPAAPKVPTVQLGDFSFSGQAASYSAGKVTLEGLNKGKQVHELIAIKIQDGLTPDQLRQMLAGPPPAGGPPPGPPPFTFAGGMQAVMPEQKAYGEFDFTPGQYAFICFVPDLASGKPHVALGMFAPFTVK